MPKWMKFLIETKFVTKSLHLSLLIKQIFYVIVSN